MTDLRDCPFCGDVMVQGGAGDFSHPPRDHKTQWPCPLEALFWPGSRREDWNRRPLNTESITNLERGIDAAINVILGMAQQAVVKIATANGLAVAGPLTGFIEALNDNRMGLGGKALIEAMAQHPDNIDDPQQEEGIED